MSPIVRRARGILLRLARRRGLSIAVGMALAAPAVWAEISGSAGAWWVEGLALVAAATGLALVWTGLTGTSADWVE